MVVKRAVVDGVSDIVHDPSLDASAQTRADAIVAANGSYTLEDDEAVYVSPSASADNKTCYDAVTAW